MSITNKVESIINKAQTKIDVLMEASAEKSELVIKEAVRNYLNRHKLVTSFIFGMGTFFWRIGDASKNHGASKDHLPGTSDIDGACTAFLDMYGTMTWRIDRKDGVLVESTDW